MTGPGGLSRAVGLFQSALTGGTTPGRRTSVKLRWHDIDTLSAACARVVRADGVANGHIRKTREAVSEAENVTRARDGTNGFLQDIDFIMSNVVRRPVVTRSYSNRPPLDGWVLAQKTFPPKIAASLGGLVLQH